MIGWFFPDDIIDEIPLELETRTVATETESSEDRGYGGPPSLFGIELSIILKLAKAFHTTDVTTLARYAARTGALGRTLSSSEHELLEFALSVIAAHERDVADRLFKLQELGQFTRDPDLIRLKFRLLYESLSGRPTSEKSGSTAKLAQGETFELPESDNCDQNEVPNEESNNEVDDDDENIDSEVDDCDQSEVSNGESDNNAVNDGYSDFEVFDEDGIGGFSHSDDVVESEYDIHYSPISDA
jgi:hypothetical protein